MCWGTAVIYVKQRGKALSWYGLWERYQIIANSEYFAYSIHQWDCGGEAPLSRGKQPRPLGKVPKWTLSGKGCSSTKTARRFAQKQLSFKECVIAHWLSAWVPIMNGTKCSTEPVGYVNIGRGAFFQDWSNSVNFLWTKKKWECWLE